jgi:hypothetical protein
MRLVFLDSGPLGLLTNPRGRLPFDSRSETGRSHAIGVEDKMQETWEEIALTS